MARNNREGSLCIVQGSVGAVGNIKSQVCFAVIGIRTMAFEAPVGKDRANIEVETDFRFFVFLAVEAGRKNENARDDQG